MAHEHAAAAVAVKVERVQSVALGVVRLQEIQVGVPLVSNHLSAAERGGAGQKVRKKPRRTDTPSQPRSALRARGRASDQAAAEAVKAAHLAAREATHGDDHLRPSFERLVPSECAPVGNGSFLSFLPKSWVITAKK